MSEKKLRRIAVLPDDEFDEWIGDLRFPRKSGEKFEIDISRNIDTGTGTLHRIHKHDYFSNGFLNCYLNLQEKAFLFDVRRLSIDHSGAFGGRVSRCAQRYWGQANSLIAGCHIEGLEAEKFYSLSNRFDGLETVCRELLEVANSEKSERIFKVDTNSGFSIFCYSEIRNSGRLGKEEKEVSVALKFEFDQAKSAHFIDDLNRSLQTLFSFLAGTRFKPHLAKMDIAGSDGVWNPVLHSFGTEWSNTRPSVVRFCNLPKQRLIPVMAIFLKKKSYLLREMNAILDAIYSSKYIDDEFFWLLPVFDRQVQRLFQNEDAKNFIDMEAEFFNFVKGSRDPKIGEFARKHVKIIDKKSEGFKQLVDKAVSTHSSQKMAFPQGVANAIAKLRNNLMHGTHIDKGVRLPVEEVNFHLKALVILNIFYDLDLKPDECEGFFKSFDPSQHSFFSTKKE